MTTMKFIDEEETIPDASTSVILLNMEISGTKTYGYIKYKEKAYKIAGDNTSGYTEKIEKIYEAKGNEGRTVGYDTNGDGTIGEDERWTVITDRDGVLEIVSNRAMGSLALGSGDTSVTVTEDLDGDETKGDSGDIAIASYNNAITTINNYCKTLVNSKEGEQVRSVGASLDVEGNYYSSTNFNSWFKGSGKVKAGDNYSEQDLWKMNFYGVEEVGEIYWIASRKVIETSDEIIFLVVQFESFNIGTENGVGGIDSDSDFSGTSPRYSVRPVVINPTEIQYID